MTEIALTTVLTWHAHCHDSAATFKFGGGSAVNKNDSTAFGSAMPSTYTVSGSNTDAFHLKIGHS